MKFVFSLFVYIAITAISADSVLKFIDSSSIIAAEEDVNDETFTADADDPLEEDPADDDEERKEKELFWISFGELTVVFPALNQTAMNTHIAVFIEHPFLSPPFSPPELM